MVPPTNTGWPICVGGGVGESRNRGGARGHSVSTGMPRRTPYAVRRGSWIQTPHCLPLTHTMPSHVPTYPYIPALPAFTTVSLRNWFNVNPSLHYLINCEM